MSVMMTEEQIEHQYQDELSKNAKKYITDAIREAATLPDNQPASAEENLDIIKHLLKRLAIHQIMLEEKAKTTNCWLIVLSIIMAIGSLFTVLSFFMK